MQDTYACLMHEQGSRTSAVHNVATHLADGAGVHVRAATGDISCFDVIVVTVHVV